ncbi:MAG: hypothetical protein FWC92_12145, partial [Defluviitaleaceae bacterium]|nr:hypothetical protein [Defluviitaleaceae bacterium]
DHFVEIFGVTPDYNTPLEQNIFLSQDDMQSYLKKIYTKTMRVFSNLTDENLGKPIINGGSMEYTHMDVIIGQIRHIMYHVGYLNSFLKRENSPVSNWYAHNEGEKLKFEK